MYTDRLWGWFLHAVVLMELTEFGTVTLVNEVDMEKQNERISFVAGYGNVTSSTMSFVQKSWSVLISVILV